MEEKRKQEKAFVFPTPEKASSSKAPKFSYKHIDRERDTNVDKQKNVGISMDE